jgi:hypothetical protein
MGNWFIGIAFSFETVNQLFNKFISSTMPGTETVQLHAHFCLEEPLHTELTFSKPYNYILN